MMSEVRPRGYGVDDVTLTFDMSGSPTIARLNELPYRPTAYGRKLGDSTSFGQWAHTFGRSVAFWKPETYRLRVDAKLTEPGAPVGSLVKPRDVGEALAAFYERMALIGIDVYEPPTITRLDVAVDVECSTPYGRSLIQGLASARLPNGWRVNGMGHPMSTVYFRPRGGSSKRVLARAYCRNLLLGRKAMGPPFGWIRLEAQERFKAGDVPEHYLTKNNGEFCRMVWEGRYSKLQTDVHRVDHENQLLELLSLVRLGVLKPADVERMHAFLDAERLGVAAELYPPQTLYRRRAEARQHGLAIPDAPGDRATATALSDLLAPFRAVWEG